MSRPALHRIVCVIVLALSGGAIGAAADPAVRPHDCPEPPADADARTLGRQLVATRTAEVRTLIAGGQVDFPLAGLFAVDPTDDAAVVARMTELRHFLGAGDNPPTPCPGLDPELDNAVRELAAARLEFLGLPAARRALLGRLAAATRDHDAVAEALDAERREAEGASAAAAEARASAEEAALAAGSGDDRVLAAQRALVEKARKDLADRAANLLGAMEAQVTAYRDAAARLTRLAARSVGPIDLPDLLAAYAEATASWRTLAIDLHSAVDVEIAAGRIAPLEPDLEQRLRARPAWAGFRAALTALDHDTAQQRQALRARGRALTAMRYDLLSQAATLRADLVARGRNRFDTDIAAWSPDTLDLLRLELRVVPRRWAAASAVHLDRLRERIAGRDLDSLLYVGQELGLLAATLGLIVAVGIAVRASDEWLLGWQRALLASRGRSGRPLGAVILRRLRPYVPWALAWTALTFAARNVTDRELDGVEALVDLARLYVVYRVALTLLHELLLTSRAARYDSDYRDTLLRVEAALRVFARYVLGAVIVVGTIETVVGHLLAFELARLLALAGGALTLALLAWRERDLLRRAAAAAGPGWLRATLVTALAGGRAALFGLPAALVLLGLHFAHRLRDMLAEYDLAKRLSARLFLRRARAQAPGPSATSGPLPADYLEWFDFVALPGETTYVAPRARPDEALLGLVRRWRDNPEGSNSVALCGHKGIGKSTVLARFAAALHDGQDGPRVVTVELREKVVSEERLVALVGAALGIDLAHGAAALVAADAQLTPTVIVIDDAHKLFLRRENGFAAFHGLAALLNARTRNLFWCAGFNHYAWRYLEDVFASAQPFRDVCELAPWSDHDIEQLIVRRHARSGYRLRFDQVILAAGDDAADYIESRFFRLLWEQSGGIPRTALALWRSAVHCVAPGLLHVSLPAPGLDARIAQLPMDVLFALAAVVRHENLTSEETTAVSGVAPAVIRQAFAVGREIGLIERDPAGRYRVCPQAQPGLVRILGTHNLIYE